VISELRRLLRDLRAFRTALTLQGYVDLGVTHWSGGKLVAHYGPGLPGTVTEPIIIAGPDRSLPDVSNEPIYAPGVGGGSGPPSSLFPQTVTPPTAIPKTVWAPITVPPTAATAGAAKVSTPATAVKATKAVSTMVLNAPVIVAIKPLTHA